MTTLNWADAVDEEVEQGTHTFEELPELREPAVKDPNAVEDDYSFPSLKQATQQQQQQQKGGKGKGKKGKTLSLAELMGGGGPAVPMMGAKDERAILMSLPTASRGKAEGAENEERGLGGAFKDYGGERGGYGRREDRRGPRGEDGEGGFMPSRADTADDWGATRQFQPSGPGGGSRGFGGGGGFRDREPRGDREPRPFSQADVADDWGSNRKFEPSHDDRRGFGGPGGFRDAPRMDGPARPARTMFDARPTSRADEEDQWSRGREFQPGDRPGPRGASGSREPPGGRQRGFGFSGENRNPDVEDRWGHRAPPSQPEPAAAPEQPAERPRLKLAPRSVPVEQPPPAAAAAVSPTADKPAEEPPKRRSNPFGEARPREEVLQEKQSVEPPKSAWGKPAGAEAAAPAAAQEEEEEGPAAAPAAAEAAPPVISLETAAEAELKQSIAAAQSELEKLQEDPDADDEDVAEATAQLASLKLKLTQAEEERKVLEKKAAAAIAEDDGSGWQSAKPKKAAATAGAPAEPAAKAAAPTSPGRPRGDSWGPSQGGRGGPAGAGRTGGFDRERERTSGGPERTSAGRGDSWGQPRGGAAAKPVAAGAPGQERKW